MLPIDLDEQAESRSRALRRFLVFNLTLVTIASVLLALLSYEPTAFWLFRVASAPPQASFPAQILPPLPEGDWYMGVFIPNDNCQVWINGGGDVREFSGPGNFHAGTYDQTGGNSVHIVGSDPNFDNEEKKYNNVSLFCGLPHPKSGEKLVVEIPMSLTDLAGSSGFYAECPLINKEGKINPGGFNAVGLSLGGTNIRSVIGRGAFLHNVVGWAPVNGQRVSDYPESGLYRLEITFNNDQSQVATLFLDNVNVGTLELNQPLCQNLELQVWLDNYKVPLTLWPLGFANLGIPERLEYPRVSIRIEPID